MGKFKNPNEPSNITILLEYELIVSDDPSMSAEEKERIKKQYEADMRQHSHAVSSLTHIFYNILFDERYKLMSESFYYTDKKSPCLKFMFKCSPLTSMYIDKKKLEYIIKDAYGMVKSDLEKEKQHEEQIKQWVKELDETEKDIKAALEKLHEKSTRKRLKNYKSLLYEKSYLQSRIDSKFSARRIFGSKELQQQASNAEINARKEKAMRTHRSLEDTYLTDEELAEIKEFQKQKIEEYKAKKYGTYKTQGDAANHGNRYFRLESNFDIIFKPDKNTKIRLRPTNSRGYERLLQKIYELTKDNKISLAVTLNTYNHTIAISYNPKDVFGETYKLHNKKTGRVMAIDLNPDYVGYTVVQWHDDLGFVVIDSGIFSLKELNDADRKLDDEHLKSSDPRRKAIARKRLHEIRQISINLVDIAAYYKCEMFSMERLKFDNLYNKNRPKWFNKLVNKYWNRTEFVRMIEKCCKIRSIKVKYVIASYSSFVGNFLFRSLDLPDPCLASIEIGRRAYMLKYKYNGNKTEDELVSETETESSETNYNRKRKRNNKGIVFPDIRQNF